jgi:hypothetical protein
MVYSKKPIVLDGWEDFDHEEMIDTNHSAIILTTGEVLSVQPNGTTQTRPAGTFGAYEVAERDGKLRIYTPNGNIWIFVVTG